MASAGQFKSTGLLPSRRTAPRFSGDLLLIAVAAENGQAILRCVQGEPQNRDKTGADISNMDFTWCMTAISWGHNIEAIVARSMEESTKARENGER